MNADLPSLVQPFRALRYATTDLLDPFVSPPYDVISPERRSVLAAQDPHNIVHLILPEAAGDKYAHAADLLNAWRRAGILVRDVAAGVYVVQQTFATPGGTTHVRTGVIAGLHVEPYDAGRVRPHERTHRGPREDRLALSRATHAMLESIFVLAPDTDGRLRTALRNEVKRAPDAAATLDGVRTQAWHVTGTDAAAIADSAGAGAIYIADGHHRFETANAYRAEQPGATHIPALVVPVGDPGLVVLPTHRMVAGNVRDVARLVEEWKSRYRVEAVTLQGEWNGEPEDLVAGLPRMEPACVVVLPGGSGYRVTGSADAAGTPVIAELEERIVGPLEVLLGGDVSYSASAREAIDAVEQGDCVAVLVPPTPLDVVLAVADAGGVMPPKSTYFAPKVPSGFVIMSYEEG